MRNASHQNEVTELLHLHARLERQLQLRALDNDVREVEQVHLERVQHALTRDDDLLRLLLNRQGTHERGDFLGRLPLRELSETLLTGPNARVDDLQEELAGARVEDEDGAVWVYTLAKGFEKSNSKKDALIGLVVKLPSNVLWIVTRYTFVSSTNQMIWFENNSE